MRLARNRALRVTQKTINDKGQRQHHQRIQLECCNRMQVQQLMKSARRSAARTLPTGYRPERTLWEETNLGGIKNEKQDSHSRQPQPDRSSDSKLPGPIGSHVDKMKISHDLKSAATRKPEPLRNIV